MITFKNGASSEYIDGFCRIFGDKRDFATFVIGSAQNVIEIYEDNIFCGGACLFDISIKSEFGLKSGSYIYGAFIVENARGRGLFKKLCAYIHSYCQDEFYDFILTIPATKELFSTYKRLGFTIEVQGLNSLLGEVSITRTPKGTEYTSFDGNYQDLYRLHIANDYLIKDFDLFKKTIKDFEVKILSKDGVRGYALYSNGVRMYVSAPFVGYKPAKKALIMPITDISVPDGMLCDMLFEI